MTRDDIIRMAREVGIFMQSHKQQEAPTKLERFAALVAAATRESMKTEGWRQCAVGQRTTQFCGQLEKAVEAEREAIIQMMPGGHSVDPQWVCDAIRARGE